MSEYEKSLADKIIEQYPRGLTLENITPILIDIMSVVGQIKSLHGHSKKQLVINALQTVSERTDTPENVEQVVKWMLPTLIDSLTDIEYGKITINPREEVSCLSCLPCMILKE